jgi:ribonuclease III
MGMDSSMWDPNDSETLDRIEQTTGYSFSNKDLLIEAFTHSSACDDPSESNERLEFLGDSVLGVVICQCLFDRFPSSHEGDLTKIKSDLVSRGTCARVTHRMGLQEFLRVGKGMASTRALPKSLEAGLLEAVIGAVYVDGGFEAARQFILTAFAPWIEKAEVDGPHDNYKSLLQQHAQEQFGATPIYVLMDEKGPDHHKCFESEVVLDQRHFPSAWGVTKKEAEQKAAYNALVELGVVEGSAAKGE